MNFCVVWCSTSEIARTFNYCRSVNEFAKAVSAHLAQLTKVTSQPCFPIFPGICKPLTGAFLTFPCCFSVSRHSAPNCGQFPVEKSAYNAHFWKGPRKGCKRVRVQAGGGKTQA